MRKIVLLLAFILPVVCHAQPISFDIAPEGHAHNDYEHNIPFIQAYRQMFGSIEADVLLINDSLYVAHDSTKISASVLLGNAYLQQLSEAIIKNNGYPYTDTSKNLRLLIDLKTPAVATLQAIINEVKKYPAIITAKKTTLIITGNQPPAESFSHYPSYIYFDGNLSDPGHIAAIEKVAIFSTNFANFSKWNGKGVIPADELAKIKLYISKAHTLHRPVRFWGAPDNINTWYTFTKLGIDFINTDHVEAFGHFASTLKKSTVQFSNNYTLYQPDYKVDGIDTKVKNVILVIGDGTGLAEWYAGYTGNKSRLNVFNMRSIGLSKTSSADNYVTDSGAGASAMATGKKTNNRYISMSPEGIPEKLITDILREKNIHTGLITTGDATDATPAAFYAHVKDRSQSDSIAEQFVTSNADILIGSGMAYFNQRKDGRNLVQALNKKNYTVISDIKNLDTVTAGKLLLLDSIADKRATEGRGNFLSKSLDFAIKTLNKNKKGFFIMAEGAQVDHGGHDNNLNWLVNEVEDLDMAIGNAMKFADENKETLVLVTADHETGGLSLLSGDNKSGYISGQFTSDDHSGICVPVFAYGPQSREFSGVYENTEIFNKILSVLQ